MVMLIPGFLSGFAQGVFNNDRNGNLLRSVSYLRFKMVQRPRNSASCTEYRWSAPDDTGDRGVLMVRLVRTAHQMSLTVVRLQDRSGQTDSGDGRIARTE